MAYRILIVDDENELQNMVKDILTQAGYETDAALSCAQAMDRFQAGNPDAVLLDINLPDGDGFSLFRQFRESRDVPILFLSARDEDADRLRGLGLGADDYITKPFLPQELLLRLRSVLRRLPVDPPEHRAQAGLPGGAGRCPAGERGDQLGQGYRPPERRGNRPHRQGVCSTKETLGCSEQHRNH